jgi:hypothetical protein
MLVSLLGSYHVIVEMALQSDASILILPRTTVNRLLWSSVKRQLHHRQGHSLYRSLKLEARKVEEIKVSLT